MGKNFSRNNASGKRKESDNYPTPYALTWEFLQADKANWDTNGSIYEPACGEGRMVTILKACNFMNLQYYDLDRDGKDYLLEPQQRQYMITNPPYTLAHEFILKSKRIITDQFAMLLPLTYLQGSKRLREVWSDKEFPLARIYVFNRFPMLDGHIRQDWKLKTGMQSYMWAVWKKGHTAEPVIRWLDIDNYILKKGD